VVAALSGQPDPPSTYPAAMAFVDDLPDLTGLRVEQRGARVDVTIDHGAINLLDVALLVSLLRLTEALEAADDVTVVVVRSANPDFFIAHFDVGAILELPRDGGTEARDELGPFHVMVERWRTMPCATIASVAGAVRGGGCEVVSSFDMRFAALGRAVFGQPEVALGILPGGSGTQRLPHLVGRGRALELVLGSGDVDARTAEAWGLVNRALEPAELDAHVDDLADRIAVSPPVAVREAKAAVLAATPDPTPGLLDEARRFDRTLADPESHRRMRRFLELGGQTPTGERDLASILRRLT
jgi:enoyl-CoA hydratase/carnithine racemase